MQKNYLQKNLVLSFLLLLSFGLNVSAQSRGGKGSGQHTDFSKSASVKNTSRTTQPSLASTQATTTITACATYTWSENGQTYTSSGTYTSGGGITQLFSDQTDWDNSATANGATISTNNLAGIPATASINITLGSVNISMNAPSGMYSSGSAVGANNPNEAVTITFSPGVYGVSANYFTADVNDNIISGNITATYSDAQVDSRTVTTDTEDFGYFSVTPITSIVLTSTDITRYISLKNFSIATNPTSTEVLDLTIDPIVTPTFATINPICFGDTLSPLPTTSINGVSGTWSPALDPTTTTTYTFTPDSGACTSTKTVTVIVNPISTYTDTFETCTSYTWPVNGQTYTSTGLYSTSIGLPDTQEIDDLSLWIEHAYSFNSNIVGDSLQSQNSGSQVIIPLGSVNATLSAPGGMYAGDDFVGTLNPNNTITIDFSTPVYGFSGEYFTTDLYDVIIPGNITVTYFSNGHVQSRTVTTESDRFGYFDNNLITKIEISTTTTVPNHYIVIKNIVVASNPHSCSTDTLDLTINNGPAPGDTLATAIEVVGTTYSTVGNNLAINCYTDTGGELAPDVWYKVTLSPCATALSLDTCTGSNFDTIVTVFAADGVTELAYSDDDCPDTNSFQSAVNDLDVTGRDVVYVMVEGYYGLNNEQGTFGLNITQTLSAQQTTTFDAVAAICNGETLTALPLIDLNGIPGTWSPALDNTVTTTYTFTPDNDQCAATASLEIIVNQPVTPTFTAVADICNGDTLSALPTTSVNGYTGTWSPALDNTQTTTYTFTADSGQCATNASLTVTVNQKITPTFTAVADICNGDTLSALPTTSGNGYTGTWSPALDNTATTTYNFTSDSGQCATNASLTITVNQKITPTFDAVAAICNGDTLSALPTTSGNGYTGTWSSTLDNTVTTTYNFTSDSGQCATNASLTITVNQKVTPTFDAVVAICNGDTLSALPTTSLNGYTGTWSPALDNTATTTYLFIPTAGQCATTTSLEIIVNQKVTPTFDAVAAICNGDTLSALPITSGNGYTGTWSPTLDNTQTTTYTFTSDSGQCATNAELTITVNQKVTPTFTAVADICNGDTLSALPTTSGNVYTGTWSPTLDNTQTTTYTFTSDSGQCATNAELTITVNQKVTPTFTAVADICNGGTLSALQTTSGNGYTGTWSPTLDNTQSTTYTFTSASGQCATNAELTITVNQKITPTFDAVADICNGDTLSALPTTSGNGYTGTWSPALDNTFTTTYTFSPTAGQCATTASLIITVNQPTTPTFTAVAPICTGDSLNALPTTSNNGYTGSWSPSLDNTATTTYTFTPDSGQCAASATLTISVNQTLVTPTFNPIASICNGDSIAALPTTSSNGFTGAWSPAVDNTVTKTYTFTPDPGQCGSTTTITITVNEPITTVFAAIPPICSGTTLVLPTTSTNGITGIWSPQIENMATTTYTFTPNIGQCGTATTLTVTVNQAVAPTFNAVAAICNGDMLTALPTTSLNGYTGAWSPTLDNTQTTTYMFTSDSGQCATNASLTITVNQKVTPTFTAVADICNGDTLSGLPTTSGNNYTGTWSPALDNTISTTYTFAPTAGQCATTASLTITVTQRITPTFTAVADICKGDTLSALPTTSGNGYTGSWSPALDTTQTTTYTFTADSGQCATNGSLIITVNSASAPTGNASQSFSVAALNDATIADLVVTPANVIWYGSLADAQSETNPLSSSTVLTSVSVYYSVNTVGVCSSEPFAVTVTVTLGTVAFDDLSFNYYPNPTSSVLNISYSKVITKVTLVSMLGQTIMSQDTNSTEVQIDLSRLADSTYFVRVVADDKEKMIKIIKHR